MQRDKSKIAAAPFRLSWAAIVGGMFAAAACWLLLHAFGLALGFSQLEPADPGSLRALGIGTGIWTVVSSMISLFAGGMVTARAAGLLGRSNAALHGIVLWGVTTVGALALLMSLVGSMARGIPGDAVETATLNPPPVRETAPALSVTTQDLRGPLNERLRALAKSEITAQQLDATFGEAVTSALRDGRVDLELFMASLAERTALPREDIREVMEDAGQPLPEASQELSTTSERAVEMTGRAFWALFSVMLLSLVSSVLGSITGVTRRQRELSARAAAQPAALGDLQREDVQRNEAAFT